jgi:hypothetical protein
MTVKTATPKNTASTKTATAKSTVPRAEPAKVRPIHTGTIEVTRLNVETECERLLQAGIPITAVEIGKVMLFPKSPAISIYIKEWKAANISRLPSASDKQRYESMKLQYEQLKGEFADSQKLICDLQEEIDRLMTEKSVGTTELPNLSLMG